MTITLPLHQIARHKAILSTIPRYQSRIGVNKEHRVLSELRSMALSIPIARGLFIQMQEALCHVKGKKVTLSKGVHEALADFCWLVINVSKHPTHIYKLVLLRPTGDGYHDAPSYMCRGVELPVPTEKSWGLQKYPKLGTTIFGAKYNYADVPSEIQHV